MEVDEIIERSFKRDLRNLLKKYNAELDVKVEMYEFGAMVEGITVHIPGTLEARSDLIFHFNVFNFVLIRVRELFVT